MSIVISIDGLIYGKGLVPVSWFSFVHLRDGLTSSPIFVRLGSLYWRSSFNWFVSAFGVLAGFSVSAGLGLVGLVSGFCLFT